jgi:hydroxyacylglutathione hydrolase
VILDGQSLWHAGTNCWVVSAGRGQEAVVIDMPPDPKGVVSLMHKHDVRVAAVLATHGHIDHVGGMGQAVRELNEKAPVHIHDDDRHMLLDPVGTSGQFGQVLAQEGIDVRPPEVIESLDHGQKVSGGGMTFTAIHTPGHTKGSVCFLLEIEGEAPVLFSGDHLFRGSIGRTDLPGGSLDELMWSMKERILPLDDEIRVLPGHGPTTTIGQERATNPFLAQLTA